MAHGHSCCEALVAPNLHRWPLADLVLLTVMWIVMMVAMMTPTAAPVVLLFAAVNRQRRANQRPYVPTGVFLAGYLIVWAAFSLLATAVQWALHSAALLSPAMTSTSPRFGGTLLIAAGVFQLTPWKHACLRHCRTPLDFILTQWRDGRTGALVMGLRHGLSCTGCCWLLMALLFVLGVMNLLWVAALTALVLLEKIVPRSRWITRGAGIAFVAWGLALLSSNR
jgi:predicted metal-binding membrane protein